MVRCFRPDSFREQHEKPTAISIDPMITGFRRVVSAALEQQAADAIGR